MTLWIRNFVLLALMLAASAGAVALRPTHKIADDGPKMDLETMIPSTFGEWRELKQSSAQIVDPQTKEAIDRIYSQTLARSYVNQKGQGVMLSIAYGGDQSDNLQVHLPEGCYAGQGFAVGEASKEQLSTPFGSIPVTRLVASQGRRVEPITYWIVSAGKVASDLWETKKTKLKYAFVGKIPDGALVRISSVSPDERDAYDLQSKFATAMLSGMAEEDRMRLIGPDGGR